MIAVCGISKSFGPTQAVREVSFDIEQGEVVGLLGPNGSGKTTLMRILTGFFPPSAGSATVCGLDVQGDSLAVRKLIGYLPENVMLYPDLTVERFLRFCATARGMEKSRWRVRIEEVLATCGLREVRGRLIGKLSKGYRQRVGLAQAILHSPRVLILDEPTVGLDPRQVIEMRDLIKTLGGSTTILLSTHILPEVSATCRRVIVLDRGRVIAQDTAESLSRRLEGVDRTLVRVRGEPKEVLGALRALSGVERVEEMGGAEPGGVAAEIYSREGESVRAALASMTVSRGWQLLEMKPLSLSLEELFVKLVSDGGQDESSSGEGCAR